MGHFTNFFYVEPDGRVIQVGRHKYYSHARWGIYAAQGDINPDECALDANFPMGMKWQTDYKKPIRYVRYAIKLHHIDKILKGELKADRTRIIVYYPFKHFKKWYGYHFFTKKECYVLEIIYCDKIQDGNVVKSVELIENGNPDAALPKEVNFLLTYLWGLNKPNALKRYDANQYREGWFKC